MASIRKRNGLWQVQVRSRHAGSTSKSFHRKTDAERWAIAQEALMQSGQLAREDTQPIHHWRYALPLPRHCNPDQARQRARGSKAPAAT